MNEAPMVSRQAEIARDVLERVMLDLQRLPGFIDRRRITKAMEAAMAALVKLIDHPAPDTDFLALLTEAQESIKVARQIVHEQVVGTGGERYVKSLMGVEAALDASRDEAIDSVVSSQLSMPVDSLRVFDGGPFGGSRSVPRLHRIAREPLVTLVDTAALRGLATTQDVMVHEAAPEDDGELDLAPPIDPRDNEWEGLVPIRHDRDGLTQLQLVTEKGASDELEETVPGLEGEIAHARRQLRDCLEELGNLGNLRVLDPDERFDAGIIDFERRMLADLDAVVALSLPFYMNAGSSARYGGLNVLEEVLSYSRASFTADPVRTYARAFVLGCVEGSDTVRAAVLALRQSSPYTHPAQIEALSLATNPAIVPAMVRLCRSDDVHMITVGLNVLLKRNQVDFAMTVPLLEHNTVTVRAGAARCLGLVKEREAAVEQLLQLLETDIDDEVACAAAFGLVLHGSRAGLDMVRERMKEELEEPGMIAERSRLDMMQMLAIAGSSKDAELLQQHYDKDEEEAEALGWHGSPSHVEPLLKTLEERFAGPRVHQFAARSLHRITGAALYEPTQATDEDAYELSKAAFMWRQWWKEHAEEFEPNVKYRFGKPYSADATIDELERVGVPQRIRASLAFELAVMSGELVNIRDWSANVFQSLKRIRGDLKSRPPNSRRGPGRFPT